MGNSATSAPAVEDTVRLTWVVGTPSIPHPKWEGVMLQPLALEVTDGSATRSLPLQPQRGSLFPHHQPVCGSTTFPLEAGEVARITFDEDRVSGYVVRRPTPGTLELVHVLETDGVVASGEPQRIEISPGVKVTEAIVEVDGQGTRKPIQCEGP